jgi:uncharacterized protein
MDYTYNQRAVGRRGHRFGDDARPSDFFRRNVFISFQEDALGIQLRSHLGPGALMWASDYPHAESTFPRSREIIAEIFRGVPADEVDAMVRGNAARLYGIELPPAPSSGTVEAVAGGQSRPVAE